MRSRTSDTLKYAQFLARRYNKQDIKTSVLIILLELGFEPAQEGFSFLRNAIARHYELTVESLRLRKFTVITLYGEDCDAWKSIDQAIRRAIHAAWEEQDNPKWAMVFPPGRRRSGCPSNKEFIAQVSCVVELWHDCKEAGYERIR